LSNDILRGLRWGAILLAGITTGLLCYRILSEPSPAPAKEKTPAASGKKDTPVAGKKDGAPANPLTANPAAAKPATPWAPIPSRVREVPPPPPIGMRVTHNSRLGSPAREKTETSQTVSKDEDHFVGTVVKPDESWTEAADEKPVEPVVEQKSAPEESVTSAASDENATKSPSRGKRVLKAVGRFLHIGSHQ
jgi:hypothetical protein